MNKHGIFLFILSGLFILASCAGDKQSSSDKVRSDSGTTSDEATVSDSEVESRPTEAPSIVGSWKLLSYVDKEGNTLELSACDSNTIWNFTNESAEPLGDGTEVQKLSAVAPNDCKFYGFEAKWTVTGEGTLFISKTKIGGMGGPSNAGLMKIVEHTAHKFVFTVLGNTFTLIRV